MRVLITVFLLSFTLLAGCGQKGPLYIAQDKGPEQPSASPSAQAGTDDKQDRSQPDN